MILCLICLNDFDTTINVNILSRKEILMLISRKHNFIFIHIYKNAGSSITSSLLPFAQENSDQISVNTPAADTKPFNPQPYHIHVSASDLIANMGGEEFAKYFSFAIVRNPWDWQVSLYSFMRKFKNHRQHAMALKFKSFKEYLRWRCTEEVRFQKDFIVDEQGKVLVDFVGRFERLETDFKEICSKIGISTELQKINVSNEFPYQSFYDDESIELVAKTFKPDIDLFNYTFN